MQSDKAYFCPSCGSSSITSSALAGGDAHCNTCPWKGVTVDLVVHVFKHDLGTSEQVVETFAREFQSALGTHFVTPLAALLYKWGFFTTDPPQPNELKRYAIAVTKASINAILEIRRELEKERVHAGN